MGKENSLKLETVFERPIDDLSIESMYVFKRVYQGIILDNVILINCWKIFR